MSFRKKTLTRPNLGGLRKKIEPKTVEPSQTKDEKVAAIDNANESSTTSSTNEALENPLSQGTKLTKRVKPKVNIGNRPSRTTAKPPDTGQISKIESQGTIDKATINPIENTELTTKSNVTKDVSDNISKKIETDCNNEPDCNNKPAKVNDKELNVVDQPAVSDEVAVKDTQKDSVEYSSKPTVDAPENPTNSSKKLSKRLKVGPKLSTSRSSSANKKIESEKVSNELERPPPIPTTEQSKVENDSLNDNAITDSSQSPPAGSKLQKRKKVMPNLKIPPKTTTQKADVKPIPEKIEDKIITPEKNVDHPKSGDFGIDSVRKTKHVHFEKPTSDENSLIKTIEGNDEPTDITKKTSLSTTLENSIDNGSVLAASPSKPSPSILKKDTHDYSSQSEGEMTSSQTSLGKGKKVFKPNLGARRRKRLSSFSAYSSCDDEDHDLKLKAENKISESKDNDSKISKGEGKMKGDSDGRGKGKGKLKRKSAKTIDESCSEEEEEEESEETGSSGDEEEEETEAVVKKKKKRKRTALMKKALAMTKSVRKNYTEERDISTLTMQELIFYRPKSLRKAELRINKNDDDLEEVATILPPPGEDIKDTKNVTGDFKGKKEETDTKEEDMGAPQVMLDENGDIIINEQSLTIQKKVDDSELKRTAIVYEDAMSTNNHRRRVARVKRWRMDETLRFYKALSQIGTDFTLMSQVFSRFTRNELKKKFKQEEKVNCDLIDMALSNRLPLNMDIFLRGKEEKEVMKELLEEEMNQAKRGTTAAATKDKGGKKRKNKETIDVDDDDDNDNDKDSTEKSGGGNATKRSIVEANLTECFVRIEKTTAVERRISSRKKNTNKNTDNKNKEISTDTTQEDDFTDFERTLKDSNVGDGVVNSKQKRSPPKDTISGGASKKKRLRVIDDSE